MNTFCLCGHFDGLSMFVELNYCTAENHRKIIREKLKKMTEEDQRFCAVTDEWTCPVKRRRYLNVSLHLKGKIYLQHGLTNSNNLFEPAKRMFCQ